MIGSVGYVDLIISNKSIFSGFIQPDILFNQVQKGDSDGFLARMSIVTPRLVSFDYDDFTSLDDAIKVEDLLRKVKSHHIISNISYTFSPDALLRYKSYYSEVKAHSDSMDIFTQPEQRSILNKMLVSDF